MTKKFRLKTRDVAFQFRMGAGFAGDVNRTHPAEIEAALIDSSAPPLYYGIPILNGAANAGMRPYAAGDQSNTVASLPYGFTVRPWPLQQSSGTNYGAAAIGAATPPASGVIDVLRSGLIMSFLNTGAGTPAKGDPIYVWSAVSTTGHIQGALETIYSAGNTTLLDPRYTFNGPPDSSGVVEVSCNV